MLATQAKVYCNVNDSHKQMTYIVEKMEQLLAQHCRKEAEDDLFVDADGLQLELLGDPVLSKEFIFKSIFF